MRINRFVFLNLPILSLGEHLGLTVSPHSPLPAGYVTLPANSRSPPLGLMLFHSEEQASSYPPFSLHSKISTSANAESRRTVGYISRPDLVGLVNGHSPQQVGYTGCFGCRLLVPGLEARDSIRMMSIRRRTRSRPIGCSGFVSSVEMSSASHPGMLQVESIDSAHQFKITLPQA